VAAEIHETEQAAAVRRQGKNGYQIPGLSAGTQLGNAR
jgi:hypothetical protein